MSDGRRRLVFATAITALAVPTLIVAGAIDGEETTGDVPTTPAPIVTEPETPVFLENTVPVVPPAVIDIARPAAPTGNLFEGTASFKTYESTTILRPCTFPKAPRNAVVTVTNIDNGLSVQCTNTLAVTAPRDADIGLDTDVFVEIADLVDAPVPVRVTW